MVMKQPDGTIVFTTDRSKQAAKEGYSNLVFSIIKDFSTAMATEIKGFNSHTPDMYIMLLLGMVVDETKRVELATKRKELIEQAKRTAGSNTTHRDALIFEANMETFAGIMQTFDNWIGIIKRQEIMRVTPKQKKERVFENE